MKNKNKKGISPLIATVIIIGLTIVLAALVVTFGTNLVKKTTEDTEKQSSVTTACSNVALNLKLTASILQPVAPATNKKVEVGVTNDGQTKIDGFIFRVYNVGETVADSMDTTVVAEQAKVATNPVTTPADYTVGTNGLKTFDLSYDNTKVPTAVKVSIKPKITVLGQSQTCGETTRDLA